MSFFKKTKAQAHAERILENDKNSISIENCLFNYVPISLLPLVAEAPTSGQRFQGRRQHHLQHQQQQQQPSLALTGGEQQQRQQQQHQQHHGQH